MAQVMPYLLITFFAPTYIVSNHVHVVEGTDFDDLTMGANT